MTATYALEFNGHFREHNISWMPSGSGIYVVYACTDRPYQTVSLERLLYIGEAANVRDRVANHEKRSEWKQQLQRGEALCFNAALIAGESDRRQAEAAMIFSHKPPCNTEYRDHFPFDTTAISVTGSSDLMNPNILAYRTEISPILAYARRS
jgi:excinuclease UvrABC nuclease subunit